MCNHISLFTDLTHIVVGTSRQIGAHLCTLLYRMVWSTIVQDFFFKPKLSERKHKCSGNVDGTTILFLAVLCCSAVSEISTY